MNQDLANFSTDLMRISYWIYNKNDKLANQFLGLCRKNYNKVNPKIGCHEDIWEEIKKIDGFENDRLHAAERALTLSRILMMYS